MCLLEFDVCGLPQLAECDNNINRFSEEGSISTEEKIAFVSHVFELATANAIWQCEATWDWRERSLAETRLCCVLASARRRGRAGRKMREDNATLISALNCAPIEQMDGQGEGWPSRCQD